MSTTRKHTVCLFDFRLRPPCSFLPSSVFLSSPNMFFHLFRRTHESLAVAAILSVSVSLHVLWMTHLLFLRGVMAASAVVDVVVSRGWAQDRLIAVYVLLAVVYLATFVGTVYVFRGRDCAHVRDRIFWFFAVSLIIYLLMTLPQVAGFELAAIRA